VEILLRDFSFILVFSVLAIILAIIVFVIPLFLAPRTKGEKIESIYECGVDPLGSAWIRYSVPFYLYALMFVAFDVDVLYLFPIAVGYLKGEGGKEFLLLLVFLGLLVLPLAYAWRKGVFEWRYGGR